MSRYLAEGDERLSLNIVADSPGTYYAAVTFGESVTVFGMQYAISWTDSAVTDDSYEENDTLAAAYALPQNTELTARMADAADWYSFTLSGSRSVTVECLFLQEEGDLDMELCAADGSRIALSDGTTDSEEITQTFAAGTYYLRVYPNGLLTGNTYRIAWN